MTWEEKRHLAKLGNEMSSGDLDINKRIVFCNYVLEKLDTFDVQAWSIFTSLEDVMTINEHPQFINYYTELAKKLGPIDESIGAYVVFYDLKDMLRLTIFRVNINNYLNKLNNNTNEN